MVDLLFEFDKLFGISVFSVICCFIYLIAQKSSNQKIRNRAIAFRKVLFIIFDCFIVLISILYLIGMSIIIFEEIW